MDTGLDLPGHVTAHQAAAVLLLLLQQLPDSFLPPDVSGVLMHCVPPAPACMSLLSDTMSVAEWATLRMLLGLFKGALQAEAAASNGLTVVGLANVLAEHFFGDAAGALILTVIVVWKTCCARVWAFWVGVHMHLHVMARQLQSSPQTVQLAGTQVRGCYGML
jgi:hypothetical protein